MTGIALLVLFKMTKVWKDFRFKFLMVLPLIFYSSYLFLGTLSISWSTNPAFSMLQLGMTGETFLFSLIFLRLLALYDKAYDRKIPVLVPLLTRAIFFHAIWFIIGAKLDPDFYYRTTHGGSVARLGGLIINPNELGLLGMIGSAGVYIELLNDSKRPKFLFLVLCFIVTMILMTQSRSSLIGFFLISGIYVLLTDKYWIKVTAIVTGVIAAPILFNTIILKDGNIEEVTSLTGRTEFWGDLINEGFRERPLLGRGFMSIAENTWYNKYQSTHSYTASMCHNTYVEVITNLGLVGAFICLIQLLTTILAIIMSRNRATKIMALFMLVALLINSITEFGIFGHNNYAIMFYHFVFLFFTYSYIKKEEEGIVLNKTM